MPKPLNDPVAQAMDKLIRDPRVLAKMREVLDEGETAGHISPREASSRRQMIDEIEREMSEAPADSN
jgi:hypothetical protein